MNLTTLYHREHFGSWLNENGFTGYGAEIGVSYGVNAKWILDSWKGKKLYLIDPYRKQPLEMYTDGHDSLDDAHFRARLVHAKENLKDHADRCEWLRFRSQEVIEKIKSGEITLPPLDFVYIDGTHMAPYVDQDIEGYWPLVRMGGILCGHDFYDLIAPMEGGTYICDVQSAVLRFKNKHRFGLWLTGLCSSWWIPKTTDQLS